MTPPRPRLVDMTAKPPDGAVVLPTDADRLTEAGAAERFAREHGSQVRFDHRRQRFLLWDRHYWKPDADAAVTRLALEFAREWQREAVETTDRERRESTFKAAIRLERRDALQSMLKFAADLHPIAVTGDGWDAQPMLLGVPNGVVDLSTGQLRDGRREDAITMQASAMFDPAAHSTLWEQTLHDVLVDDAIIDFFQLATGYSTTGDMKQDRWFLTHGSGRNGKGTLLGAIQRALGAYAMELPASVFDLNRDGKAYELAALPGKRFVMSSETGDTIRLHHDRIKQISGGSPITAANKYERAFEFTPMFKLWLSANRKPRVNDDSPAFWARVLTVPFPVSFVGREDRDLRPTLEHDPAHQSAVLAWLVRGAVRYHAEGLQPPTAITAATSDYQDESDVLADFCAEALGHEPESEVRASDLYLHYCDWARSHHISDRERMTATMFGRRMTERFKPVKRSSGKVYLDVARKRLGGGE